MRTLFSFLFRLRATFLFLLLEFIAFWLIVQHNHYQGLRYFNSANYLVASTLEVSNKLEAYFYLKEVNKRLAEENRRLHQALVVAKRKNREEVRRVKDPILVKKYKFMLAEVVNKTTLKANNYITVEKGRKQGVFPGMGVISPEGVVGKVTESSTHYARVMSVLHRDIRISAQLKSNGYVGYIDWNGKDARFVKMKDVPTPVAVKKGDSIIASGYNAFFPQGTTIGTVAKVEKLPDATFHDITVKLATDFNSLTYVYIIGNNLKQEKDSLESKK